jgi:hypothetical protein
MATSSVSMWMEGGEGQWPEKWDTSSPKFLEILVLCFIPEASWLSIKYQLSCFLLMLLVGP